MNIFAIKGDKIKFSNPNYGYEDDRKQADKLLKIGKVYTVERVEIGEVKSVVYLKEFPLETRGFNTVQFSDVRR